MAMFVLIALLAAAFICAITWSSYVLGKTKTNNAQAAATVGFVLSFLPPLAVIYLLVLLVMPEIDIV